MEAADSWVFWCPSTAASGTVEQWHGNCIAYTSPWSPCSTTCGLGISTRISNVNARCWPEQESRLCNLRPCEVDIHPYIKVRPEQRCPSQAGLGMMSMYSIELALCMAPELHKMEIMKAVCQAQGK